MWCQCGVDSESACGVCANVPLADMTEGEFHHSSIHMAGCFMLFLNILATKHQHTYGWVFHAVSQYIGH